MLVIITLLGIALASPVRAQVTQGFYWQVQPKDYYFFIDAASCTCNLSGSFYVRVTSESPIMGTIASWSQIPTVGLQMFWINESLFDVGETIFDALNAIDGRMAVPVGNWALLGQLVEPILTGERLVEDALCWGIEWKQNKSTIVEQRVSVDYLKSDGFLARYQKEELEVTTGSRIGYVEVTRQDLQYELNLQRSLLLMVGIGGGIVILTVIGCKIKRPWKLAPQSHSAFDNHSYNLDQRF